MNHKSFKYLWELFYRRVDKDRLTRVLYNNSFRISEENVKTDLLHSLKSSQHLQLKSSRKIPFLTVSVLLGVPWILPSPTLHLFTISCTKGTVLLFLIITVSYHNQILLLKIGYFHGICEPIKKRRPIFGCSRHPLPVSENWHSRPPCNKMKTGNKVDKHWSSPNKSVQMEKYEDI